MRPRALLLGRMVTIGLGRWRRWLPLHILIAVGLAASFSLLLIAMSLPGAITKKNTSIDSRSLYVSSAPGVPNDFFGASYVEHWGDKSIVVTAIDVETSPVRVPTGQTLRVPGETIISSALQTLIREPDGARLLSRLLAKNVIDVVPLSMDAERNELVAYVGISRAQLETLCACSEQKLGRSQWGSGTPVTTGHLSFGFIFLIAMGAALIAALIYTSASLATSMLAERERRLFAEMSLLGVPTLLSGTVLGVGLMIDATIASGFAHLLARHGGRALSKLPPSGYRLPSGTLGHPSLSISIIAEICLLGLCILAVARAGNGLGSQAIRTVRTFGQRDSHPSRGVIYGIAGIGTLWALAIWSEWAEDNQFLTLVGLVFGVLATARGVMDAPFLAQLLRRFPWRRSNPTTFIVDRLINSSESSHAMNGVVAALVIAAGIFTSYATTGRGGDAVTLGASYENLRPEVVVVTGATSLQAAKLKKLKVDTSVELQLVTTQNFDGQTLIFVVGDCDKLRDVVSHPEKFECSGDAVAIDQSLFTAATGLRGRSIPRSGSKFMGLDPNGQPVGRIEVGQYGKGQVALPGDVWLNGATVLLDSSAIDFQPASTDTRWVYLKGGNNTLEAARDTLAPAFGTDTQLARQLAIEGNRRQIRFFLQIATIAGLLMSLLAGLALGLNSIAEFPNIQRQAMALMLLGAPRAAISAAIRRVARQRMFALLTASVIAATAAAFFFLGLVRASEYGLTPPLFGFNWWLILGVSSMVFLITNVLHRAVVRAATRSTTLTTLR